MKTLPLTLALENDTHRNTLGAAAGRRSGEIRCRFRSGRWEPYISGRPLGRGERAGRVTLSAPFPFSPFLSWIV